MKYNITLTFTVDKLDNKADATDFANSLAEHVCDTFNDDETISPEVWVKVAKVTT